MSVSGGGSVAFRALLLPLNELGVGTYTFAESDLDGVRELGVDVPAGTRRGPARELGEPMGESKYCRELKKIGQLTCVPEFRTRPTSQLFL